MNVLLLAFYELGRQPFGLASPAAWLRRAGARVTCNDLSAESLDERAVRQAHLIALHLPMHTATRLAAAMIPRLRRINPRAHLCAYGLYAPMNATYLRGLGVETLVGGEFEGPLVRLMERLRGGGDPAAGATAAEDEGLVSLDRQQFVVPDRRGLPPLTTYAQLVTGKDQRRIVGSTEATRGCKHLCRHCPVVPVYGGRFRVVQRDVVLEDVRQQVAAGAQHITFGDPDFFNGIGHVLPLVRTLHAEHPDLTYDVTIKIEHLLKHAEHLPVLRDTGCLFVTSAVESLDDRVLEKLDKGHTRADVFEVVRRFRDVGLILQPTFVAFTPWTSLSSYRDLLAVLAEWDLVEHVPPVQLVLRLLIPGGSRLLELVEVRARVGPFDAAALVHPWRHPDPSVDRLQSELQELVSEASEEDSTRGEIFDRVWQRANAATGGRRSGLARAAVAPHRPPVPYLTEPWYC